MRLIDADALINRVVFHTDWPSDEKEAFEDEVNSEPTVEPEPKTGKWKQISPAKIYECDQCGQQVMTQDIESYKFCHGCGVRMEGDSDE